METKNIQDFLELAELGSSYAAAEKLFVSQSTLVRHIQSIEEEFGVALFDRTRTGFVLNEAGNIFLPYAKKIALTQKQCHMALHHEDEESKIVRVCSMHKIVDLVMDFKKLHPEYIVEFTEPSHADVQLREGLLDVAFVSDIDNVDNELVLHPYINLRVMIMVYESHPLARQETVTLEELKDEPFIIMTSDRLFSEDFMNVFGDTDFQPIMSASVPTGQDVIEMVKGEMGIAMIHGLPKAVPVREGIKILDLSPQVHKKIDLVYRDSAHLSQATKDFIDLALERKVKHQNTNLTFL